ncbi:hypothetical protein ScalyP_jg1292 [Parmales sp. scaly parma]|nr:hypothetical protein ScalyP_jg1292 [Parmales sp. scaly parma]
MVPHRLAEFLERGVPQEVADVKLRHFESRRLDKVKVVTEERTKICQYLSFINSNSNSNDTQLKGSRSTTFKVTQGPTITATATVNIKQDKKSSMIDLEMKRFETMRRRQEKEIKRIIANETKLADLQKKMLRQEAEDARRKKEHHKRVQDQKAAGVEAKRKQELERKARDEEELARRREISKKDAEFEITQARLEVKRERLRARDASEKEMERTRILEAQKEKTQAILDAQELVAEESRRKQEEKTVRVAAQLAKKRLDKHVEITENRKKAKERIDTVIDKNKQNQLDKRLTYLAKQEEIRKFKIENEIVLKEKAEQLAKNLAERQARQRGKKEESMKFYEDKKNRTLTQLADREQFIQVVEMEREHERSVKNLNMELAEADKRANVQRIKRMDEFMRLQTMKKLQSDDARTVAIRSQKQNLGEERRKMAHENFLRKCVVKEAMDQMKITNKFIDIEEVLAKKSGKKKKNLDASFDSADGY